MSATRRTATTAPRWRGRCAARRARIPSASSTAWPISVMPAPPMSMRCVGPHRVTSWPNRRCHMSSSGKPVSANAPQAAIIRPPTGAHQSPPRWMALFTGRSVPARTIAITPATSTP